jgi:hypothetical protein
MFCLLYIPTTSFDLNGHHDMVLTNVCSYTGRHWTAYLKWIQVFVPDLFYWSIHSSVLYSWIFMLYAWLAMIMFIFCTPLSILYLRYFGCCQRDHMLYHNMSRAKHGSPSDRQCSNGGYIRAPPDGNLLDRNVYLAQIIKQSINSFNVSSFVSCVDGHRNTLNNIVMFSCLAKDLVTKLEWFLQLTA